MSSIKFFYKNLVRNNTLLIIVRYGAGGVYMIWCEYLHTSHHGVMALGLELMGYI